MQSVLLTLFVTHQPAECVALGIQTRLLSTCTARIQVTSQRSSERESLSIFTHASSPWLLGIVTSCSWSFMAALQLLTEFETRGVVFILATSSCHLHSLRLCRPLTRSSLPGLKEKMSSTHDESVDAVFEAAAQLMTSPDVKGQVQVSVWSFGRAQPLFSTSRAHVCAAMQARPASSRC